MRPRAGFTMLEMIVVLLLVGIVMVTAMPRISNTLARNPVKGAATAISVDLRRAQSMAGRQRKPIRVSIDTVNKVIRLRDYTTSTTVYGDPRYFNNRSETPLQSLATNDTLVLVYPNGTTDGAVTITATVGTQQRTITMTRAGLIRVGS
jgi:prepilin-type N-terminal cleavage/methylation domain-containing protein